MFAITEPATNGRGALADLISADAFDQLSLDSDPRLGRTVDGGGGGPDRTVVLTSPRYLPLPTARELMPPTEAGRVRVLRGPGPDEVVALVASTSTIRRLRMGVQLGVNPIDMTAFDDVLIGGDRMLDVGREDDRWLFEPDDAWFMEDAALRSLAFVRLTGRPLEAAHEVLPFWFLRKLNAPIGAFARMLANDVSIEPIPTGTRPLRRSDIDVIAVTTNRYRCVRELLRSVRGVLGEEPDVTVVIQAPRSYRWHRLAQRHRATFIHVDADRGLAWSRNLAVARTRRPLVFLMDDDFQLDDRCRVDDALSILDARPDISVLGGNLLDVGTWSAGRHREVSQGFAMRMLEGPPNVTWLRLEDAPRRRDFLSPTDYVESADIVDNFALFRRAEVFDRGVHWNPGLKIGAEHQDLYLRLRALGGGGVARTNALKVRNVRVQSRTFRRMRRRTDLFFPIFFRDSGLRSFRILGERLRVQAQDGGHVWQQGAAGQLFYIPSDPAS